MFSCLEPIVLSGTQRRRHRQWPKTNERAFATRCCAREAESSCCAFYADGATG